LHVCAFAVSTNFLGWHPWTPTIQRLRAQGKAERKLGVGKGEGEGGLGMGEEAGSRE